MKTLLTTTILAGALALSSAAYAGSGHDHGDHNHRGGHDHGSEADKHDDHGHGDSDHHAPNTPEFEHKDYGSVAKAWEVLNQSVGKAETAANENKLEDVHGIYPELSASAHYLLDHSDLEDAAKQTRLKAALGQLTKAIESFHEYSHSGDDYAKEAGRELKKMQGALKLIKTYYPAEMLKGE